MPARNTSHLSDCVLNRQTFDDLRPGTECMIQKHWSLWCLAHDDQTHDEVVNGQSREAPHQPIDPARVRQHHQYQDPGAAMMSALVRQDTN